MHDSQHHVPGSYLFSEPSHRLRVTGNRCRLQVNFSILLSSFVAFCPSASDFWQASFPSPGSSHTRSTWPSLETHTSRPSFPIRALIALRLITDSSKESWLGATTVLDQIECPYNGYFLAPDLQVHRYTNHHCDVSHWCLLVRAGHWWKEVPPLAIQCWNGLDCWKLRSRLGLTIRTCEIILHVAILRSSIASVDLNTSL